MERKLTQQERERLIASHRKERDRKVCDRIKAVLLRDQGYSTQEIAKILLLDEETIRRHIQDYFLKSKLAAENGGGQSYLNKVQTAELIKHLEEKVYLYVKDICAYVEKVFRITYSISGMTKWLQEHHFRYKQPHGVPAKADKQKQAEFVAYYEDLKATKGVDEVIYFGDSTHPQHQTKLMCGWIKKGVRKAEKMTACQKRVNIIGALNIETKEIEARQVDWVNYASLKLFCEQLIEANPQARTIHLFLDNAGYHTGKLFKEWIKTTKIQIHYLPPYSPNLNPIERFWKIMHEQVTYNRYYEKFVDFKNALTGFFGRMDDYQQTLNSRITDNFQKL
ncbi:MAG: IS630 family transposase [Thermodesulfobium sp.]